MAASGRVLAIGDVHGCLRALERLIDLVAPTDADKLVFLGDYVDRGPDSRGVINWLMEHQQQLNLITLRGNHDQIMLDARNNVETLWAWQTFGGTEALASYDTSPGEPWVEAVPQTHWDFLESTDLYHETSDHIFVHGALAPDLALSEQSPQTMLWARFHDIEPHQSGKRIVCGHTSQKSGSIAVLPHAICIDTWVMQGWLTCLDVTNGIYWQTRQNYGQTRKGII
jgi:serine/threonine protein phosphatase 1